MDEVKCIKPPEFSGAVDRICHRYHIRRLGLFGSAARRELTPERDIDLLVELEHGPRPRFRPDSVAAGIDPSVWREGRCSDEQYSSKSVSAQGDYAGT